MFRSNLLQNARKLVVLAVACMAMAPLSALAQVSGYLSNFNIVNNSGQDANDFELYLGGISPAMITSTWWGGGFNQPQITNLGTGSLVHWQGGTVHNGDIAHFGVHIAGDVQPRPVTYSWTYNGKVISSVPPTWQGWDFNGPKYDVIQNWSSGTIFVQRRYVLYSGQLQLGDLMRDSPIWNSGTIIDPAPVPVPPGGTLRFQFPQSSDPNVFYVLMYDETDSSGRLVRTFLNAAQAVPAGGKAKGH